VRKLQVLKDVGADLSRVYVSGIKGAPPPPTTKVTIFYEGGFQSQIILNATGYGTAQKWALFEIQLRRKLKESGADKALSILEFQMSAMSIVMMSRANKIQSWYTRDKSSISARKHHLPTSIRRIHIPRSPNRRPLRYPRHLSPAFLWIPLRTRYAHCRPQVLPGNVSRSLQARLPQRNHHDDQHQRI